MAPTSPEVAKLEFAKRISGRRRELELSAVEVSKALGFSRVFLSAIENGRDKLSPTKLPALFDVLRIGKAEQKQLRSLLEASRRQGWWRKYGDVLPEDLEVFIGLEHGAARASIFESAIVPGLLQTKEYAEAVVGAATRVSPANVERTVALRLRRQERLVDVDPLRLDIILSEAVLWQEFGGPLILRNQLRSILHRVETGAPIEVRVQPFDRTPGGLFSAATVVLLEFDSPHLPTVAWRESAGYALGDHDDAKLVAHLGLQFEKLRGTSLSPEDSLRAIESRIGKLAAD